MSRLTIHSLIDDNPEITESYECEHKIKDGKHLVAFNQPIYTSTVRTVVTATDGKALLLRNTAVPTRLQFTENETVNGSYFTGIGAQNVMTTTRKVSVEVCERITKIRIHYSIVGLAEQKINVKMNMTIED